MSNPWETNPEIFPSKSKWFSYLRGCLRKAWTTHPVKLNVLKEFRKQIPNPNPKGKAMVWGGDCSMCGKTAVMKEMQVDHIIPAGSLAETGDIQGFVERLLYVSKDDLRLVCKECNSALSLSAKGGITYEEAKREKEVIKIIKSKKDKEWLEERNVVPATNQKLRRKQILDVLNNMND